jgi:anti-sigma B factor antagonist
LPRAFAATLFAADLFAADQYSTTGDSFMQLTMSTRSLEGVLIVDCSGRLVFGEESARVRDTVKQLLAQSPKVVMNLREVNYIDSGGLGTLVSLFTTARNAGGAVKLASLSQRVGDLLQVTKLFTIFEVFDSEEAAARSFSTDAA